MNGESSSAAAPTNPPELDQSWRDGHTNKSLGLLVERLASQCYFDLNTTLTEMDTVQTEPQHQQANGIMPHTTDTSESSLKKKRHFMNWASTQRESTLR